MPDAAGNLDAQDYRLGQPQKTDGYFLKGRRPFGMGHEGPARPGLQPPQRTR